MKYSINDLVLKSPGMQIRDLIIENYGSIGVFAEKINLYETSINQYLSNKNLGSATFKIRTTNEFGKNFNELYLTDEAQIRIFASNISGSINEYNKKDDIKVLEKLKMMTLEYELLEDYAIVCRAYAHYYVNQGKMDRGHAYIDVAVNTMRDRENVDRFGLYLSDQVAMKSNVFTKREFKKALDELLKVIKNVTGPLTRGHMYYNIGLAYMSMKDYNNATESFKNVFNYHYDTKSRSFVYLRLGDVEKVIGNEENAFFYYSKAESLLDKNDDTIYYVYDEYANYYFSKNNLEEAERFIDIIFNDKGWKISSTNHDKLITYAKIKISTNKENELIQVVKRLVEEIDLNFIYTIHHLYKIDKIIETIDISQNCLIEIIKVIKHYYNRNNHDSDDKKALKQILGSIVLKSS